MIKRHLGKKCYSKDSEIRVFIHFSITTPYKICFVEFLTNHKNWKIATPKD
jgi:hypothetical protein